MHKPSHRWDVVFLAIGIVLASTGRTFAARLVPIALSVNGKVAMKASWETMDIPARTMSGSI